MFCGRRGRPRTARGPTGGALATGEGGRLVVPTAAGAKRPGKHCLQSRLQMFEHLEAACRIWTHAKAGAEGRARHAEMPRVENERKLGGGGTLRGERAGEANKNRKYL